MAVTLTSAINTATPPYPREIAAADVNGDGRTDLVVMTHGNSSNGHQQQAVVLLGDGQGSFQASQSFAVGSGPITTGSGQFQNFYAGWAVTGVALGDVNGDGCVDIIRSEAGFIPQGQQGRVVVSLGNGNGTFQAGQAFATSGSSEAVTVGDVNGDGKLDIVTVNGRKYNGQSFENAGSISVLIGNGDGTFQGARQIVQGHQVTNVTLAHLNFDQHQDMVTTWWDSSGQGIDLWSGDGAGGFNLLLSIGANGMPGEAAVTFLGPAGVDFSPDILVATSAGLLVVKDIYNAPTYVTSSVISSLSVADLDGDGRADDVVVGGIFDTSYLIGNGNGTFQAAEPLGGPESVAVATAFVNGDGWIDIIKVNLDANLSSSPQGSISVLLSDTLAPNLHSIVASTASTRAGSITETVTFSEAVTGVDAADFIVVTANGTATGQIGPITGSGASYTVTVNGITGTGGLRLDLKSTGTGIVDLAGRAITGTFPSGSVTQILSNATPVATAATLGTNEDTLLVGHLAGTDGESDSLTFAIVPGSATNGTMIFMGAATGEFWFAPAANFSGTASFQFTASDGNANGTSAPKTITINVAPVEDIVTLNNPPPSGGLNVNTISTTNPGADTVKLGPGFWSANGTTTLNVNVGSGATLGGSATVGDVRVLTLGMVRPGNSPGTLTMGDVSFEAGALFGAEIGGTGDGQYDRLNVTGTVTLGGATLDASVINDFDPETATGATFTLIDNDGTDAVDGTFADLAEGAVFAIDGHSFSITYQGGSDDNDVVLTAINDAPVVGGDQAITVAEGGPVVITTADLTATDPDTADAQLVFTVTGTSHGSVLLDGAAATSFSKDDVVNGRVSFQHDGGEADGSFSVALGDGAASGGSATIAATVSPQVNDVPVIGGDHAITVAEGGQVVITTADLTAADPDNVDAQLDFSVTGLSHGIVLLDGTFTASFTKVDVVNGRVSFQHDGHEADGGFTVALSDGSAPGGSATIAVAVDPHTNDAPVISGDHAVTVAEGGLVTITTADLSAFDLDNADAQLVFMVTGTSNGNVLLDGAATASFTRNDVVADRVSFRHDGGEADGGFTVALSDGAASGGSATISVAVDPPVNDAPAIGGDHAVTVAEGGASAITIADLAAIDPDNTDDQLVFTVTGTSHGSVLLNGAAATSFTTDDIVNGRVSFQHDGGEADGDFTVALSDGAAPGGSATIAVAVDPHDNDAPIIGGDHAITVSEGGSVAITTADLTATDPDHTDAQLAFTVTGTSHGTVLLDGAAATSFTKDDVVNGRVSFRHDGGEADGSFTVGLSDGDASGGSATIAVAVDPHGNDAPVVGGDHAVTVAEGGAVVITTADLTAADPDNSDDQLVFTVTGASHGAVLLDGVAATSFTKDDVVNGRVSFLHDGGELDGGFTVALGDGSASGGSATIAATVDPHVNDAPAAGVPAKLAPIGVNSGAHLITQAALLVNATDVDGPPLAAIELQVAQGAGTLVDNNDGTWTYTPKINDDTQVAFSFLVTDGVAAPVAASATLDILPAQASPEFGTPGDDSFTAVSGNSQYHAGTGVDTIAFDFKLTDAVVTWSGNQVIIDGPSSHTVLSGFEVYQFTDGTVNTNDGSPLIDDLFYNAQNHDVWNAQIDADFHYNAVGWKEGRDPSAFFDTGFYLTLNPDARAAGVNPLTHYHTAGWKEGRLPSLAFGTQQYLDANPDVKAAQIDPLFHFLLIGASEGRQPIAPSSLIAAHGFDLVYYLQHNPDVAAAHVDPLQHFQTVGWKEGRDPNASFDTDGYLAAYADVRAAGINPFDHYNQFGWHEGRDPSVNFDTNDYLAANPDVKAAGVNPLLHFLQQGVHEGRSSQADGIWG
jgi:hypothetical protein